VAGKCIRLFNGARLSRYDFTGPKMKMFSSAACVAVLILTASRAAHPQNQTPESETSPYQISVNLNLVVLPVAVRDKKGGFASDLREQDFEVYEDGVRQTIRLFRHEDIPVTAGLVVDHSGSMQTKMTDVLMAARTFVHFSNPEDQMFVVNFNERVTPGLPPSIRFTNREDEMQAAILKAPVAGETALYDAMNVALDSLQTGEREKKVLLVISDGGDNASTTALPQILKKAEESTAIIYAIGIYDASDPDKNPGVLRRIAKATGGEAFFPDDISKVGGICEGIARDIRHQYAIGYVSGNTQPGGRRVIRVTARSAGKDLIVRTRTSYTGNAGLTAEKDTGK
jgi:Ca-activated chloride channel family protein